LSRRTSEDIFVEENVIVDKNVIADKVCLWWKWSGTFDGELCGIKPTGQFVTVRGASLLLVKNFKLISAQAVSDIYQVVGQLPPK
jgi:predicted ester cyclase